MEGREIVGKKERASAENNRTEEKSGANAETQGCEELPEEEERSEVNIRKCKAKDRRRQEKQRDERLTEEKPTQG